jgi:hypothetical protein
MKRKFVTHVYRRFGFRISHSEKLIGDFAEVGTILGYGLQPTTSRKYLDAFLNNPDLTS